MYHSNSSDIPSDGSREIESYNDEEYKSQSDDFSSQDFRRTPENTQGENIYHQNIVENSLLSAPNFQSDPIDASVIEPEESNNQSNTQTINRIILNKQTFLKYPIIMKEGSWPKYIGTFLGKVSVEKLSKDIDFKKTFEFQSSEFKEKQRKNGVDIKYKSVYVMIWYEENYLGKLEIEHHEMLAFLLNKKYIKMNGYHYKDLVKNVMIEIRVDIFLEIELTREEKSYHMFKNERKKKNGIPNKNEKETCADFKSRIEVLTYESIIKLFSLINLPVIEDSPIKQECFNTYNAFKLNRKPKPPLEIFSIYEFVILDSEEKILPQNNPFDYRHFESADQPNDMANQLDDYQLKGLQWMLFREKTINLNQLFMEGAPKNYSHPLYQKRKFLNDEEFYFNTFNGHISILYPTDSCRGGILADDIDMGKTVMMIALMLQNRYKKPKKIGPSSPQENENAGGDKLEKKLKSNEDSQSFVIRKSNSMDDIDDSREKNKISPNKAKRKKNGTLIVTPSNHIDHWYDEIKKFAPIDFKTFIYIKDKKYGFEFDDSDVVLTSYQKILDDYKNKISAIKGYKWFRIVLDESHNIKNVDAKITKALNKMIIQYVRGM